MIQGVHGQSVVFLGLELLEESLKGGLWLGPRGYSSVTELALSGSHPDRFVVRIGQVQAAKKMASCGFQLESPAGRPKPMVRGTLEFMPVPKHARTKVLLQGMADRDLLGGKASTEAVRSVANEYARQLLSEVAGRLEARAGELAKATVGGS